MNKPWLGYLSSALIFIAGIIMIFAKSYVAAALMMAVAVGGAILKFRMNRK